MQMEGKCYPIPRARYFLILVLFIVHYIFFSTYTHVVHEIEKELQENDNGRGKFTFPDNSPDPKFSDDNSNSSRKFAYVTLLCDNTMYEATLVLVHSLKRTNTTNDLVVMTLNVSYFVKRKLKILGAKIIQIDSAVKYPFKISSPRLAINKPCRYSKLLIWKLMEYDKLIYLDSDLLVLQSIDDLFARPTWAAVPDILPPDRFNSGLMVIKPNREVFEDMMKKIKVLKSPNFGDQGFLNNYLRNWYNLSGDHHLGFENNALVRVSTHSVWKFFVESRLRVLHFSGSTKPWNTMIDQQFPTTNKLDHLWWKSYNEAYAIIRNVTADKPSSNSTNDELPPQQEYCQLNYMAYKRGLLTEDKFSVVMNTFDRLSSLKSMVKFYDSLPLVHKIYIVWGNPQLPPISPSLFNVSKPVEILYSGRDDLNDRFLPVKSLETECLLICDDDIQVTPRALSLAFKLWRGKPNRLVGFFPRSHLPGSGGRSGLESYEERPLKSYSIVLTKSFFISADYLHSYSCRMGNRVRTYVSENKNCEDIAMNLLVSKLSGLPPLYVADSYKIDYGTSSGLSARTKHRNFRSICTKHLKNLLQYNSPPSSSEVSTPFSSERHISVPDLSHPPRSPSLFLPFEKNSIPKTSKHFKRWKKLLRLLEGQAKLPTANFSLEGSSVEDAELSSSGLSLMKEQYQLLYFGNDELNEKFRPVVAANKNSPSLLFLGLVQNSLSSKFATLAHFPSEDRPNRRLCLLHKPSPSSSHHHDSDSKLPGSFFYSLPSLSTLYKWQEAAALSQPLKLTAGTTLIIHSQVNFNLPHTIASLAPPLLMWRSLNGCFAPSKVFLFHNNRLKVRLSPWATLVLGAILGSPVQLSSSDSLTVPECFHRLLIIRRIDSLYPDNCIPFYGAVQSAVQSQCMKVSGALTNESVPAVIGASKIFRVLVMAAAAEGDRVQWVQFESVKRRVEELCLRERVGCQVLRERREGSVCESKVLGLGSVDLAIGLSEGDEFMANLLFFREGTLLLQVRESYSSHGEMELWRSQADCHGVKKEEVLIGGGVDSLDSLLKKKVKEWSVERQTSERKPKFEEKCLLSNRIVSID